MRPAPASTAQKRGVRGYRIQRTSHEVPQSLGFWCRFSAARYSTRFRSIGVGHRWAACKHGRPAGAGPNGSRLSGAALCCNRCATMRWPQPTHTPGQAGGAAASGATLCRAAQGCRPANLVPPRFGGLWIHMPGRICCFSDIPWRQWGWLHRMGLGGAALPTVRLPLPASVGPTP